MNTLLSAASLKGDSVVNPSGENLGKLEEIMLDTDSGRIGYAVLSFGGFLGMGDKLFAIPWDQFNVDTAKERLVLNIPKDQLENAPGFDKNNWPNMADRTWGESIHSHYSSRPYWQ